MKAIVITPRNLTEIKFLTELLEKLGISAKTVELEDIPNKETLKAIKDTENNIGLTKFDSFEAYKQATK